MNANLALLDANSEIVKVEDMKLGNFYRVVSATNEELVGALACLVHPLKLSLWMPSDAGMSYEFADIIYFKDLTFVAIQKFALQQIP